MLPTDKETYLNQLLQNPSAALGQLVFDLRRPTANVRGAAQILFEEFQNADADAIPDIETVRKLTEILLVCSADVQSLVEVMHEYVNTQAKRSMGSV